MPLLLPDMVDTCIKPYMPSGPIFIRREYELQKHENRLRFKLFDTLPSSSGALMKFPSCFASLEDAVPGIIIDMRYAGPGNFIGDPIDGYEAPKALLTLPAARAVASVQSALASQGLGLKIFDAYRPVRAVQHFIRWAADPGDIRKKTEYYPNLDKPDLFQLGFISANSAHCRGSTIDLTLVSLTGGGELPMGSAFDYFGPSSRRDYDGLTRAERTNRDLLRTAMDAAGFDGIEQEWWHFTLRDEPYSGRRFDFVIR